MKTIIAGSRGITDYEWLKLAVESLDWSITEVVSGGARGVDRLGEQWANENGVSIKQFIPDWNGPTGRGAGYIRNEQMAHYADALLALWDGESRGTAHMIRTAQQRKLKVVVVIMYL